MTPMHHTTKAAEGGYGEYFDVIGKLAGLFMATKFDQSWGPFIYCGTMGAMGPDGLHDGYLICPTYGADAQCTRISVGPNRRPRRLEASRKSDREKAERGEDRVYTAVAPR